LNYMHNLRKLIVWSSYTLGQHNNMMVHNNLDIMAFKMLCEEQPIFKLF
jgi:hypothetical protein